MKTNKILGLLFIFAIVLAVGWFLFGAESEPEKSSAPMIDSQETANVVLGTAFLVIDDGLASPVSFELNINSETTAFDLLVAATEQSGAELLYSESELGVFIEKIGGTSNGDENRYWLYFVNKEMPMTAADKYIVKPEDVVEFRFEKSPF